MGSFFGLQMGVQRVGSAALDLLIMPSYGIPCSISLTAIMASWNGTMYHPTKI